MKSYGFEVAHNYQVLKGYLDAENKEQAIKMIENEEWTDIIDEFDVDAPTEGYEVVGIWEIN